jgi:hypothetical protein
MSVDNNGRRTGVEDYPSEPLRDQPGAADPSSPSPSPETADGAPVCPAGRRDPSEAGGDSVDSADSSSEPFEAARAVPQALKVIASIIAPTTLLTALFAYFGLLYAIAYYRYFGVNYTVLDLPVQGYLILSASTAVLPLGVLAGAALLSLWLYQLPLDTLPERGKKLVYRWGCPAVAASGLLLIGVAGMDAFFAVILYPPTLPEARGISMSAGVVLLGYASRLRRELRPRSTTRDYRKNVPFALAVAKWGSFCLLLGIGMFWAVGSYALRMGAQDAHGFAASLHCAPDIVLYSAKKLNLESSGLHVESSSVPDTDYRFRYPGLKLVPQAGAGYLLLPGDWQRGRPTLLVSRSDTVRLEFVVAARTPAGC